MENNIKKRLMYLSTDDPYYICFWIIITLDFLNKKNGNFFTDSRKLLFIITLISNDKAFRVLEKSFKSELNQKETSILFDSYKNGMTKRSSFTNLLISLEKRNILTIRKSLSLDKIDITLNKNEINKAFFDKKKYKEEYDRINIIKTNINRMTALTLDTFIEKAYSDNGVKTWQT